MQGRDLRGASGQPQERQRQGYGIVTHLSLRIAPLSIEQVKSPIFRGGVSTFTEGSYFGRRLGLGHAEWEAWLLDSRWPEKAETADSYVANALQDACMTQAKENSCPERCRSPAGGCPYRTLRMET